MGRSGFEFNTLSYEIYRVMIVKREAWVQVNSLSKFRLKVLVLVLFNISFAVGNLQLSVGQDS